MVEKLTWKKRHEFTLSIIGYVVGMGNVFHFPRMANKNGGVIFLIPYITMVMVLGLPMMMMEISLGQFCSRGVTQCWGFSRMFSGIGISMVLTSGLVALYYNMLVAWAIYYFGASFTFYTQPDNRLPWDVCDPKNTTWLSDFSTCKLNMTFPENSTHLCTSILGYFDGGNGVCYKESNHSTPYGYIDLELARKNDSLRPITLAEDFFRNKVNKKADSPDGAGSLNPVLVVSLIAAWSLVFLCVCKGIRSIGKVVYVTATIPYIILLIMIIYGFSLKHSGDCLVEFLTPKFEKLSNTEVWQDAAIQAMFSLGISAGSLITLSAYNDFSNNTFKSTLIVVIVDTLTSIVATMVVFMYLGVLSHDVNVRSCDVIKDDPYLAFHVFPYAVTKLPAAPVWSILFFFMMIMLGLDTMIADVETVIGSIIETFKPYLGNKVTQVHFCGCLVFCICGFIFTSRTGLYWYDMFSAYVFTWNKLVTVFLLSTSIGWVYSSQAPFNACASERFRKDIEIMIGPKQCCCRWKKVGGLLEPFWKFVIPLGVATLCVYMFYAWENLDVWWLDMLGWCIASSTILPIPIVAIVHIVRAPGESLGQKLRYAIKPTRTWGPTLQSDRKKVLDYIPGFVVDPNEQKMEDIPQDDPPGEDNFAFDTLSTL